MNEELLQRARALLDGPTRYPQVTGMAKQTFFHVRAMKDEGLTSKIAIARELAVRDETIAELLAEVERLTLAASEHRDGRLNALERATAAEARLRELASAEPVAWAEGPDGTCRRNLLWRTDGMPRSVSWSFPLIRRPEMPS